MHHLFLTDPTNHWRLKEAKDYELGRAQLSHPSSLRRIPTCLLQYYRGTPQLPPTTETEVGGSPATAPLLNKASAA